jgi:uncharacterized phage protein (TIGR02218 family)
MTDLLLVGPLADATYRGFTLLDADVTYTPSVAIGSITFKARTGMEMMAYQSSSDLSVDNSEANTLLPVAGFPLEGITQQQIDSGALDGVKFCVLRINYADHSQGAEVIAGGRIGEVRQKVGGLTVMELRSLAQLLKQSIVELDSLTCRAKFGSQVGDERYPCGFDLTDEWVDGVVVSVSESDRVFTDTSLTQDDDYFAPGLLEWLTGDNVGQQIEVDTFAAGVVSLKFPTVSDIADGDTYRIRRQCGKHYTGHNSCETFWGAQRTLHFRGEPWIPVGAGGQLQTPGAAIGASFAGTGETPTDPPPYVPDGGTSSTPPPVGGTDTTPPPRTRGTTVLTVSSTYGDGITDATAHIQSKIDALPGDGGTVIVPAGTYLIDTTTLTDGGGLELRSNMLLSLASGATLKAKTNTQDHDYILRIRGKSNVEVTGGTLLGDLDTFVPQTGTTSEWGHGIACYGSSAVSIHDITITKCVGDCISIGGYSGSGSSDVKIWNCNLSYSRRQGISLVWATSGVEIFNNEISYIGTIHGTSPMCGIDIEPEAGNVANGTVIRDNDIHHCNRYAVNIEQRGGAGTISGVTIKTNTLRDNYSNGLVIEGPASGVAITANTIKHNSATGIVGNNGGTPTITGNTFSQNYYRNGVQTRTSTDITGMSGVSDRDIILKNGTSSAGVGTNTYA